MRVAEKLHITPAEVDAMPEADIEDCMAVWTADANADSLRQQRQKMLASLKRQ